MELTDLRKEIEECPDRMEQFLNREGILFEKEQTVIPKWTSTAGYYINIRCGLVILSRPCLSYITQQVKEAAVKYYGKYHDQCFYVDFRRKSVETEAYYVELLITLTRDYWRRVLDNYSLYELATESGPKLYPVVLRATIELGDVPWS